MTKSPFQIISDFFCLKPKQVVVPIQASVAAKCSLDGQKHTKCIVNPLPDRTGTFLIADIHPPRLGLKPDFKQLVGRKLPTGQEFVGCVLKASEGLGWGAKNDAWFQDNWKRLAEVGGDRHGVDWFRGAYHFLRFNRSGTKQAEHFVEVLNRAGGFIHGGDLMPWVDAEEGGQGDWAGGEQLSSIRDPGKRARLTREVEDCLTGFVSRFKTLTGLRIAVYGRGIFRDLGITNARYGQDSWANPAYTKAMPSMDRYGVPLDQISFWQLCGGDSVAASGFPNHVEGWGSHDYSVYIDGDRPTTLSSLRKRCLAHPPSE